VGVTSPQPHRQRPMTGMQHLHGARRLPH
jgi:hypothetical protein